ncbi:Protein of uncharacterised function (DUF1456) [Budvicia aquatica]|uniref:Protein of uncharacterized function (DUF1456) n=1 Tax=Budvicia aquatica TaxID=82979 RepID=A0A484ZBY8_9GAMM|nr:Protein of uncharacterised function (DUF1456) [Budvicia aquatica]
MLNNHVLRSVRYMLDLSDAQMVQIIKLADLTVTQAEMVGWLKKDDEPEFRECDDKVMGHFLNGLIFSVAVKMRIFRHRKSKPRSPIILS